MSSFLLTGLLIGLFVAVVTDLLKHRIPNLLVIGLVVLGFLGNALADHSLGVWTSTSGLLTGLICFLPLHIFGALGAGDVKLLAAVGAVVGAGTAFSAALMTIAAGGFIALAYITLRGGFSDMIRRYWKMLVHLFYQHPIYIPPAPGEAAGLRFPYALAIASGTVLAVL